MTASRLLVLLVLAALPAWAMAGSSSWPTKRGSDVSWGKGLYNAHCWQCHGRKAEGDGPAAEALQVPVPGLRGRSNNDTRGDLVTTARQGSGPMPTYEDSISRQDVRRIFLYIESLDDPEEEPEEDPDQEAPSPTEEGNQPEAEEDNQPDAEEGNQPDAEGGE
jgi:mono/diheme cytochrome c family protein